MAYYDRREFASEQKIHSAAPALYKDYVKRGLDLLGVAVLAPPIALVVMIAAVFVALDGHSPFYRQKRVGKNGKIFSMIKLRSMVPNADKILEDHLKENTAARQEWDVKQKLSKDPRITRVGRILRKTSLDELPQLWNVLRGDMSLVGPRPMMPCQQAMYPGQCYYALRPGITGPWQVSERNETSFAQRAFYDSQYLTDISLKSDITLIFKTVSVVVRANGQ